MTKQKTGTIVHRLLSLGIVLAMLAALIVAAEWVVRYRGAYRTWTERNGGEYYSPYQHYDSWFFLRKPRIKETYNQTEFDYEFSTNAEGLRDREHPVTKPPREFRVIAIGDSFTEGQGARTDETWPRQLEVMLNADLPAKDVRVISAGVAGSDPIYGYKLLEERLLKYQPDLVVVAVNTSDIEDLVARGGRERFGADGTVKPPRQPKTEWLFEHSHLFRLMAMDVLGYDWMLLTPQERALLWRAAIDQLADVATRFQRLGETHGFDVLVVMHPMVYELRNESTNYAPLLPKLEQGAVEYVDLYAYLRENFPEGQFETLYWPVDRHHNAEGYRAFAAAVAVAIKEDYSIR